MGPDAPDADRRRLALGARRLGAARRGRRGAPGAPASRSPGSRARARSCSPEPSWSRSPPSRPSSTSACRSSRCWLQPILIMLAAGDRRWSPRGPLRAAAARSPPCSVFVAIRGVLALLVGPRLRPDRPHLPALSVEALVVEGIGLLLAARRPAAERPISFGALCGLGIGTIGLAAEWAWNQTSVVNEWVDRALPRGRDPRLRRGARRRRARRLRRSHPDARRRAHRADAEARRPGRPPSLVVAVVAFAVPLNAGSPVSASFDLTETELDGQRAVTGTVTPRPARRRR